MDLHKHSAFIDRLGKLSTHNLNYKVILAKLYKQCNIKNFDGGN